MLRPGSCRPRRVNCRFRCRWRTSSAAAKPLRSALPCPLLLVLLVLLVLLILLVLCPSITLALAFVLFFIVVLLVLLLSLPLCRRRRGRLSDVLSSFPPVLWEVQGDEHAVVVGVRGARGRADLARLQRRDVQGLLVHVVRGVPWGGAQRRPRGSARGAPVALSLRGAKRKGLREVACKQALAPHLHPTPCPSSRRLAVVHRLEALSQRVRHCVAVKGRGRRGRRRCGSVSSASASASPSSPAASPSSAAARARRRRRACRRRRRVEGRPAARPSDADRRGAGSRGVRARAGACAQAVRRHVRAAHVRGRLQFEANFVRDLLRILIILGGYVCHGAVQAREDIVHRPAARRSEWGGTRGVSERAAGGQNGRAAST